MTTAMRALVEVLIDGDKVTTIAFQEWALRERIISTGASSVHGDGLRYYFEAAHTEKIRAWLSSRADDKLGSKRDVSKVDAPRCECVCRCCAEGDHCGGGKQEGLGDCMHEPAELAG